MSSDKRQDDNQDQGTDDQGDQGFSDDQQKAIDARVNAAVSNQLSRFRKSFEADLDGKLDGKLGPIADSLKSLQDSATSRSDQGDQDDKGNDQSLAELQKAQARIDELERKNKEAEQRAQDTEHKRLASEERTALQKALREAGVDEARLRGAVALLYGEDAVVARDSDGNIVMKVQRSGYVDEVTLDEGVAEWLKSDEGKAHLPARGTGGSGASGSTHQRRRGPTTKEERVAEARRTLANAFGIPTQEQ